jgi:hypothetical protein
MDNYETLQSLKLMTDLDAASVDLACRKFQNASCP